MELVAQIRDYYHNFKDVESLDLNIAYFVSLFTKKKQNVSVDLVMNDGINNSCIIPLPIATKLDLEHITIQDYELLKNEVSKKLKKFSLCICKMQAGLGTSVVRDDLLAKYTKRSKLGSKGTDLFIKYHEEILSIAEVQLLQAESVSEKELFKFIAFQNLINEETKDAVLEIWEKRHYLKKQNYKEIFSSEKLKHYPEIFQLLMPTIAQSGEVSFDRMAPAGHGYIGFSEIVNIYTASEPSEELLIIGNGEDLRSTPDSKIFSWIVDQEIPIVMMTTTKLEQDKKGGQLVIVNEAKPYITIVEKAQAQKANQVKLFEQLGLRPSDKRSLFNTNIVIINKYALKKLFMKHLDVSAFDFQNILSPDLIENKKEQDGSVFTQLEGALGSSILNLDKFFRQNFDQPLVNFLNLAPQNRAKFFLPIKTRGDFDEIYWKK
ncbi:MAG: hypothetical protein HON90_06715 [Halobacteriovoraceae bacterium]|jgi:hypothetical protein|nr:hypothetical protein [Halobacteriovoraceae bacterium]